MPFGNIDIVWSWLILSLVLMTLEAIIPGVFLLWFGIAAFFTGLVAILIPDLINIQYAVFAIISVISVIMANTYFKKHKDDAPSILNRRGEQYIGKKFTYTGGKVKVGDTWWMAEGEDLKDGDIVEVTDISGTIFKVKR